ncbi:MAG: RHS repeat-associated core domain-containing protein [Kiritimatiellia bacterium]
MGARTAARLHRRRFRRPHRRPLRRVRLRRGAHRRCRQHAPHRLLRPEWAGLGRHRCQPHALRLARRAWCAAGRRVRPHRPLYLTRHRLYSASLQRFLSPDPLGLAGGLNLYAYAEGDPLGTQIFSNLSACFRPCLMR